MPVHHFRIPLCVLGTGAKLSLPGKSHPEIGSPTCGPIGGMHNNGKKLTHNPSSIPAPPYNQTHRALMHMHAHSYSHAGPHQPGEGTSGKKSRRFGGRKGNADTFDKASGCGDTKSNSPKRMLQEEAKSCLGRRAPLQQSRALRLPAAHRADLQTLLQGSQGRLRQQLP